MIAKARRIVASALAYSLLGGSIAVRSEVESQRQLETRTLCMKLDRRMLGRVGRNRSEVRKRDGHATHFRMEFMVSLDELWIPLEAKWRNRFSLHE